MDSFAEQLTYLFAVGAVLLLLVLFLTVLSRVTVGSWFPPSILPLVERYALWGIAGFSTFASVMSLYYSEVVGFEPCVLCWLSRAMMYPLALISIYALVRKDFGVAPYTFLLASVGMVISIYHHLYQMGVIEGSFCNALAGGVDCAKRLVFEFGFVTMPLMGFAAFAAIALLSFIIRIRA